MPLYLASSFEKEPRDKQRFGARWHANLYKLFFEQSSIMPLTKNFRKVEKNQEAQVS